MINCKHYNIKELLARIARLEWALISADLPSNDAICQCCEEIYLPRVHDSVRCFSCLNCVRPKNSKEWIRSDYCKKMYNHDKNL